MGRWKVKIRFKRRALTDEAVLEYTEQLVIVTVPPLMNSPPPCTHRSTTGHSIGAMGWGMVACLVASCAHIPVSARVEQDMSEKVHPSGRWMKGQGKFTTQALT